ncbi:hypothetical protein BKN38_02085 [Helicobacter sp. CLO-3]|uniref:BspA family leucine-rich repeat surface protein n=1 Tax=unclassified Helicobacter TaxID=2593540 RepID=UPI000805CC8F|nr:MULTISPECIES: BspA family leucine-rich repeat surface protein [unclassified Helicobacter]OBV29007.1 hypothetical protein BA723_01395 [Helicobacter sp. CLO-3]OHU84852.1 hypothetical protein BKN38_02085 [Helicobacter sp. CLO-3]
MTTQNLKSPKNTSEARNLKALKSKLPNLKQLAFIGIAALGLMFSACAINTNPLTDKSKHKYRPQTRDELVQLLKDESIKLDTIDTSKITDMSFLFAVIPPYSESRKDFSGIETWDTSNVTDMNNMFSYAKTFNQPIGSWDVSNVEDMSFMFREAESFNQPLNKWNVSRVKNMLWMFRAATSFNQPLDKWDVSKVKDMNGMFQHAESFNQPLES